MTEFKKKELLTEKESIGQLLKKHREEKGLSLKRISRKLKIKIEYIKALEEGNYKKLPSKFYAHKFLQSYINYLKLDSPELKESLNYVFPETNKNEKVEFAHKKIKKNKFIIFPKIIRNGFIILGVLACLFYLGFYLKKVTTPPELKIEHPPENIITEKKVITVKGQTEKETEITINNKEIITDKDGSFEEQINLKVGVNIITITAQKKYSKENIITRQILVK